MFVAALAGAAAIARAAKMPMIVMEMRALMMCLQIDSNTPSRVPARTSKAQSDIGPRTWLACLLPLVRDVRRSRGLREMGARGSTRTNTQEHGSHRQPVDIVGRGEVCDRGDGRAGGRGGRELFPDAPHRYDRGHRQLEDGDAHRRA